MTKRPQIEPYDFVPLEGSPERKPPTNHHLYQGKAGDLHSGRLHCRLTVKSPVFIYDSGFAKATRHGHETVTFPIVGKAAVIQGTSLKGVLRAVVEAIEPCCFTLPSWDTNGQKTYDETPFELPDVAYRHCWNEHQLCFACRLFGSLGPSGTGWAYAGNVSIGDARANEGEYNLANEMTLIPLMTPKPEKYPSGYTIDGKTIRGRKLYRHRRSDPLVMTTRSKTSFNKTVRPVEAGSIFRFQVDYTELHKTELSLLLYALELEDGLWHKIGMGKPIGMGSAEIRIERWERLDRQSRYKQLGGGWHRMIEAQDLRNELSTWLQLYHKRHDPVLDKLRDILRPDETVDVRYTTSFGEEEG